MSSARPIYSWADTYLALADAFGAARAWQDDIEGGQRVRRCPATTNADAVLLGAIFTEAIKAARDSRARLASLWEACEANIERSALPPEDGRAKYRHNRSLWHCIKEACLDLDHDGTPPLPRSVWDGMRAQIADPIDHNIARNRWRNDFRKDVKVTEGEGGKVTFEGWKDYNDLYLAQWDYFQKKRGSDKPQGEKGDIIPRTTNADVLQLATLWTHAVADAEDEGLGNRPGMMEWDTPVGDWKTAAAHVATEAAGHDPNAPYAHNEEFWRALDDVSSVLTIGKKAPTKWDLFVRAAEHSITHLPENIVKGVKVIAGAAEHAVIETADTAGTAANKLFGGLFGSLKWPLIVGGGALGVYLVTRNREHAAPKEAA
jgi:hypothetical protein